MSPTNDMRLNTDLLSIAEVEQYTGIRQATLRMWEKRYGFPQPLRDRYGARVYPLSQVTRLHAVRRLIDQGIQPGRIFSSSVESDVTGWGVCASSEDASPEHLHLFNLLREYRQAELHSYFQYRAVILGLRRFVIEFLAPLSVAVGLAWSRGHLPIRCEHLYSQLASSILHAELARVRTVSGGRPKVLLATLTGEAHVLGAMMAEAVMTTLEMDCIQLGCNTPPLELALASREIGADIVAMSFSSYFPHKGLIRSLTALRAALPATNAIWVGGAGAPAASDVPLDIEVFETLEAIAPALVRWRSRAVPSNSAYPPAPNPC